jgi:hypothetical protein
MHTFSQTSWILQIKIMMDNGQFLPFFSFPSCDIKISLFDWL